MNVIYLNENLKYCEAFPDEDGKVIIKELNLIVGFVDRGKLFALEDTNNEVLTPFEVFVQFNDMSINMIERRHFQEERRVIDFDGYTFCEINEVFTCQAYVSVNQGLVNYFNDVIDVTGTDSYAKKDILAIVDNDFKPVPIDAVKITLRNEGFLDYEKIVPISGDMAFIQMLGEFEGVDYSLEAYYLGSPTDVTGAFYKNFQGSLLNRGTFFAGYQKTGQFSQVFPMNSPYQTNKEIEVTDKEILSLLSNGTVDIIDVTQYFAEMTLDPAIKSITLDFQPNTGRYLEVTNLSNNEKAFKSTTTNDTIDQVTLPLHNGNDWGIFWYKNNSPETGNITLSAGFETQTIILDSEPTP